MKCILRYQTPAGRHQCCRAAITNDHAHCTIFWVQMMGRCIATAHKYILALSRMHQEIRKIKAIDHPCTGMGHIHHNALFRNAQCTLNDAAVAWICVVWMRRSKDNSIHIGRAHLRLCKDLLCRPQAVIRCRPLLGSITNGMNPRQTHCPLCRIRIKAEIHDVHTFLWYCRRQRSDSRDWHTSLSVSPTFRTYSRRQSQSPVL